MGFWPFFVSYGQPLSIAPEKQFFICKTDECGLNVDFLTTKMRFPNQCESAFLKLIPAMSIIAAFPFLYNNFVLAARFHRLLTLGYSATIAQAPFD